MKIIHPHAPNITLESLLRRRKTNLEKFVETQGITTYELLVERCARMGVSPPKKSTFESLVPPVTVSSPAEGVVVIPAPELINGETGEPADELPVLSDPYPATTTKRKKRKGG